MKAADSRKANSFNVGSPIYMPPEALNDNKYSFKSDVWAIGVIYYELLTGRTPWKAKTEKELGRQLLSVPIHKLMPPNISPTSIEFLEKTLSVGYEQRMTPDELQSYMQRFDAITGISSKQFKTAHSFLTSSTKITGTQCSIKAIYDDDEPPKRHETSLNKNTLNTPKNMRRFTLFKCAPGNRNNGGWHNGTMEDIKTSSLPKTASTINRTQTTPEN
jgi:serine/threonine protein kinase